MSTDTQQIAALVIVASAAGWLIWRTWLKRRRTPGCSPDCGCGPKLTKRTH